MESEPSDSETEQRRQVRLSDWVSIDEDGTDVLRRPHQNAWERHVDKAYRKSESLRMMRKIERAGGFEVNPCKSIPPFQVQDGGRSLPSRLQNYVSQKKKLTLRVARRVRFQWVSGQRFALHRLLSLIRRRTRRVEPRAAVVGSRTPSLRKQLQVWRRIRSKMSENRREHSWLVRVGTNKWFILFMFFFIFAQYCLTVIFLAIWRTDSIAAFYDFFYQHFLPPPSDEPFDLEDYKKLTKEL
jgi:hypothetical protein